MYYKYKLYFSMLKQPKDKYKCILKANTREEMKEKIKHLFLDDDVYMSGREGYYYLTEDDKQLKTVEYGYDMFEDIIEGKAPKNDIRFNEDYTSAYINKAFNLTRKMNTNFEEPRFE